MTCVFRTEPALVDGITYIPLSGRVPNNQKSGAADARAGRSAYSTALPSFFAGPENRLVEVAVRSVLFGSAGHNPLVFYGPTGTGKSHLARGLAAQWKTLPGPQRSRVIFITAADFARKLADAIETQATDDFRAWYKKAGLLVIDDLGELSEKRAAQEELIHVIDALVPLGRRVVITAPSAPGEMAKITPMLQSRLTGGLTVPLCSPGPVARRAVLRELAIARGIELPETVTRILADGLCATVPELRSALLRLEASTELVGGRIDAQAARDYLTERNGSGQPSLRDIAVASARHFSLKLSELRSSSRCRPVVTARGVAMYLSRLLTQHSLGNIGDYFGGRDHSTVMHGCRRTEQLVKSDPTIREAVEQLRSKWTTT